MACCAVEKEKVNTSTTNFRLSSDKFMRKGRIADGCYSSKQ